MTDFTRLESPANLVLISAKVEFIIYANAHIPAITTE